jgi:hypothetical protein
MLYHPWRDEDSLKSGYTSYYDKYQALKTKIDNTRKMFEPFADAVDEAARCVQTLEDLNDAWDQLAPGTQHEDAIDFFDRTPPVDAGIEN